MSDQPPVPPDQPGPPEQPPAVKPPQTVAPHPGMAQSQVPPPTTPKPPSSGKATASMVLGICGLVSVFLCSWFTLGLISLVLGILAIVFGVIAKNEIRDKPELEGSGQAQAGFVTGIIATALSALFIIAIIVVAAADS